VYPLVVQAIGAQGIEVQAKDYGHDLHAMRAAVRPDTRAFLSPIRTIRPARISRRATSSRSSHRCRGMCSVVLDEAYNEYWSPDNANIRLPGSRSMEISSSAHILEGVRSCGLRVGYAFAAPSVADLMNRVRQPFNVNSLSLARGGGRAGGRRFRAKEL